MTTIDTKLVGDLVKIFGPTDEQRKQFSQTFLGSLLGQATILVGLLVAYAGTMLLGYRYAMSDIRALQADLGPAWFWTLVGTPLLVILLFSVVPTTWRALRERRLKARTIGGGVQFKPGYFRLHPYEAADRQFFRRLDGADKETVDWLLARHDSLLYFSGASGVGKSSLLSANVLPALRDAGWSVIETRPFGDPAKKVRAALASNDAGFDADQVGDVLLRTLLDKVSAARAAKNGAPLLIVIDQFEEFLILDKEDKRVEFVSFLRDLAQRPIDKVRLLLVFRSDYRALIFKLELPPLQAGTNWRELAPYSRGEATTFLGEGGRELTPESIEALLRGLDRIEDTPGLYRPITLNMVGLVLERMGRRLEGDPERLIQSYLVACLSTGESRDFAKPILSVLINESGMKEPRTEEDIVARTGFAPWQVAATLATLWQQGLARPLHGQGAAWEIAHDFLARAIGQLLGRLRPSIVQRLWPAVAPVVVLAWIALAVVALPDWLKSKRVSAEADLRALGATLGEPSTSGLTIEAPDADDAKLEKILALVPNLGPVHEIKLPNTKISRTDPLKILVHLPRLKLSGVDKIVDLRGLEGLTALKELHITQATQLGNLDSLKGLTGLTHLDLRGAKSIRNLEPLRALKGLTYLNISEAVAVTTLEPLVDMTRITRLNLDGNSGITSLDPLKTMTALSRLSLNNVTGITTLEPLAELKHLSEIEVRGATRLVTLAPLRGRGIKFPGASDDLLATAR